MRVFWVDRFHEKNSYLHQSQSQQSQSQQAQRSTDTLARKIDCVDTINKKKKQATREDSKAVDLSKAEKVDREKEMLLFSGCFIRGRFEE